MKQNYRLHRENRPSVVVEDNSMLPLFHIGDTLYYEKTNFKKIYVNDVILVNKNSALFSHRVIYKAKSYLITKGDNSLDSDARILSRHVKGIIKAAMRNRIMLNPENIYLFQTTAYLQELLKINNNFQIENVRFVYLKGIPIHLYYKKTFPRRLYLDCDILIERNNFDRAEKILRRLGYKKVDTTLSRLHKKNIHETSEISFHRNIHGIPVVLDIHLEAVFLMTQLGKQEFFYPQALLQDLTKNLLEERQFKRINGNLFPLLSYSNQVLYLALHLFHHNFKGIFRYALLHYLISQEKLFSESENEIIRKIDKYKLNNFVYPVFILLKKHYEGVSDSFIKKIHVNFLITYSFKKFIKTNIFNESSRLNEGIQRFFLLFLLSPYTFRKFLILIHIRIYIIFFWVLLKKISSGRKMHYFFKT